MTARFRNAKLIVQVYQPIVENPEMRGLIHFAKYAASLEMAKQAIARGQEHIDDYEPPSDLCTKCANPMVPTQQRPTQSPPLCRDHL